MFVLRVDELEGEWGLCIYVTFCTCVIHLLCKGKGKGKGKGHPITGHEGPEGE